MSDLTALFERLNRDYFGGRKPRYRVLRRSLRGHCRGYCDRARRRILIGRELEGDELTAILLHEMCHIGCDHHGNRFKDRIRRLLPLVPAPVAAYLALEVREGPGLTLKSIVWDALDWLAMESPDLPWRVARQMVVEPHLYPTFDDREGRREARLLAWAKREWEKLSRESREMRAAQQRFDARSGGTPGAHSAASRGDAR